MAVSEEECSTAAKSQSSAEAVVATSSSSDSSPHYLAKCVLRPSVVLQVAYGRFRSQSSRDVVFGKETCIELAIIGQDGILQSVCEQTVFGTIKDLAVIPWNSRIQAKATQGSGKDLLAIVSDSGKLSILLFCSELHRFCPVEHIQFSGPGNSRHELGRMLAVHSSGCFLAISAYHDSFAMISLSMSNTANIIDKVSSDTADIIDKRMFFPPDKERDASLARLISGTIWSMSFISKDHPSNMENDPVLAIVINRQGSLLNDLLLFRWNISEQLICLMSEYVEAGPLVHSIVEVPHSYGLAFLFRVGDALLMDLRDAYNPCCLYRTTLDPVPASLVEENFIEDTCKVQDVDDEGLFNVAACALLELSDYDPMCIDGDSGVGKSSSKFVCSWSWEPKREKKPRMIICLDGGEFLMIEISYDFGGTRVNLSDCLYKGLACKEILWVESGYLATFAEMGDGMVFKVETDKLQCVSPIQNIAPILDMSVVDDHDEKHDQMFACCGVTPDGSLRVIRSGISVEKLLKTPAIYQGITSTWTMRMKFTDIYHSFLVLSFVEETRVLTVGLSFTDVTDSVGFQPDVCTLACGLVADGLLVQIHQNAVRLCMPTKAAHFEGVASSSAVCRSWFPNNVSISLGAVGENLIVVSTSNPCYLSILGIRSVSSDQYEIFEMQHVKLQYEVSCISIPQKHIGEKISSLFMNLVDGRQKVDIPAGIGSGCMFVMGTHRPSVEVLSVGDDGDVVRLLASGLILLTNPMGTAVGGCIPQDVRLVLADQLYVLSGLRNGMLLRFEWPSASVSSELPYLSPLPTFDAGAHTNLQLIATRRIGITPVFLVPLTDALDADIIVLSDRTWLLQTARRSLSYTSISFQSATHATPVCSVECPKGILFVAENSLHLVEMVHNKRLNVQKFHLGGTPRKVIYHSKSRRLIVLRTDLSGVCSSDICCVDSVSGSVLSSYKLKPGEIGKSMEIVQVGNEQVLVVGTSLSCGPATMASGEAESTRGRLVILCIEHTQISDNGSMTLCSKAGSSSQRLSPFRDIAGYAAEQLSTSSLCSSPDDASPDRIKLDELVLWHLRLTCSTTLPGMVLAICPYLDRYFLASAGNAFYVCGFPNDNPERVRKFAVGRTRFIITSLTAHFTRIAVGDCRDGVLFYSYHEEAKRLEQIFCDPSQRLVADCFLMDVNTAVVSDRKGSLAVLSCFDRSEDVYSSPESNLNLNCAYYIGEAAMRIRKGSCIYKLPADDVLRSCYGISKKFDSAESTIIASTVLGSIFVFFPISREEFELLEAVQARLVVHPLTAPILGNDHSEFRSRENLAGVTKVLDGDMLAQFLELTCEQQEAVLSPHLLPSSAAPKQNSKTHFSSPLLVNQVVQLLERVHYALN